MSDQLDDFTNMRFRCTECFHDFVETVSKLKRNPNLTCPRGHVNFVAYSSDGKGFRIISARAKALQDRRKQGKRFTE